MSDEERSVWSPEQMDRVRRQVMSYQEAEHVVSAVGDLYNAARALYEDVQMAESIGVCLPDRVACLRLGEVLDSLSAESPHGTGRP